MKKEKDPNIKIGYVGIILIFFAFVLVIFSFFAPKLFVQEAKNGLDFSDKGQIGDTIGGLMSPFIALAGVIITFLAFYIQYLANKQQIKNFRKELDSNKFENQFYEMVRLHKENVNEISLTLKTKYYTGNDNIWNESQAKGREVFEYFLDEIDILYKIAKKIYPDKEKMFLIIKSYQVFFLGISHLKKSILDNEYFLVLNNLRSDNYQKKMSVNQTFRKYEIDNDQIRRYNLFSGQSSFLGHYFRHLFQTVKFVVNQKDDFIDYSGKRKYLRMLRAQLSNQEQALLFYNWLSKFGIEWENKNNKFFSNYRMIHNINTFDIIEDFDLAEIFKLKQDPYYQMEEGRKDDFMFEFQS